MIVQRKGDFDAMRVWGEYWEDVEIPTPCPDDILGWLANQCDRVGTEYQISEALSTAIVKEHDDIRYVDWKTGGMMKSHIKTRLMLFVCIADYIIKISMYLAVYKILFIL